ncbi:hypothetical protein [Streptomyces sp. NPDC047976]|uniref:hypothetical protein n=1 Tax=Streptomyces sp. NPDC047976 TaxID=3155746 RepID=UPI003414AAB6
MRVTDPDPDPASDPGAGPDVAPDVRSDPHTDPVVRPRSGRGFGCDAHTHAGSDVRPDSDLDFGCDAHGGSDHRPDLPAGSGAEPRLHVGPDLHARSDGEPVHLRADPRAGPDGAPHPHAADFRLPGGEVEASP